MNSKSNIVLASIVLAAGVLVFGPCAAQATPVTIDQIIYQAGTGVNSGLLSGTLDITASGNTLTILMRNTSPDAAFTSAGAPSLMLLTGFGLQLPGVDITGGTVAVNGGSVGVNFGAQSTTVLGNQYNYANQAIGGFTLADVPAVNAVVSSVNNGQATRFIGAPPTSIGGPDFGALSASETQFGSSQEGVRDTVKFVLTLNGPAPSVSTIDAGNVVLAFGSPNAVPDGGTTVILLGMALTGLGLVVRRRS